MKEERKPARPDTSILYGAPSAEPVLAVVYFNLNTESEKLVEERFGVKG